MIIDLDEAENMEDGVKVHPHMSERFKVPQSIVIEAMKIEYDESGR